MNEHSRNINAVGKRAGGKGGGEGLLDLYLIQLEQ